VEKCAKTVLQYVQLVGVTLSQTKRKWPNNHFLKQRTSRITIPARKGTSCFKPEPIIRIRRPNIQLATQKECEVCTLIKLQRNLPVRKIQSRFKLRRELQEPQLPFFLYVNAAVLLQIVLMVQTRPVCCESRINVFQFFVS